MKTYKGVFAAQGMKFNDERNLQKKDFKNSQNVTNVEEKEEQKTDGDRDENENKNENKKNDNKNTNEEKRINLWKNYILIVIRLNYKFILYVIENDLKLDIETLLFQAYGIDPISKDYQKNKYEIIAEILNIACASGETAIVQWILHKYGTKLDLYATEKGTMYPYLC